jgi:hypothetical protein
MRSYRMKILNDFLCDEDHVTEALRDDSEQSIICPVCGNTAVKALAAPQIKLEGFSGAFPDAYDRWSKVRADKLKQEQKQNAE